MAVYRGFIVWGFGIIIVLGAFLIFVAAGWPGDENNCVNEKPHECFCEEFKKSDVLKGASGVRQPVNTWFNLYAIATSFVVALFVYLDREKFASGGTAAPNLIRSDTYVPDLYIFAVLFLGLGSMWFHASLTAWGGILDGVSMYVYAAFLCFYSIRRLWDSPLFFWIGYAATIVLFTVLHAFQDDLLPSFVLIGILVVAYLVFEVIIWITSGKVMLGETKTVLLWLSAVVAILAATFFWWASHTDQFMCDPKSWFQPHGLLWHPLAGVMAVLLYFYWREADDTI